MTDAEALVVGFFGVAVLFFLTGWRLGIALHNRTHGCRVCNWYSDRGKESLRS